MLHTPSSAVRLFVLANASWLALVPAIWLNAAGREPTDVYATWDWGLLSGFVAGMIPVLSGVLIPFVAPLDERAYLFLPAADCPVWTQILAAFGYLTAGALVAAAYVVATAGWGEIALVMALWSWVTLACRASLVHGVRHELVSAST